MHGIIYYSFMLLNLESVISKGKLQKVEYLQNEKSI